MCVWGGGGGLLCSMWGGLKGSTCGFRVWWDEGLGIRVEGLEFRV